MIRQHFALALVAVVLASMVDSAFGADHDDISTAQALLRGVEATRGSLTSGAFRYSATVSGTVEPLRSGQEVQVEVVFSADKFRLTNRRRSLVVNPPDIDAKQQRLINLGYNRDEFVRLGLGQWETRERVVICDGEKIIQYPAGANGAAFSGFESAKRLEYLMALDPRSFGIASRNGLFTSLREHLMAQAPAKLTTVGKEQINGKPCWHLVLKYDIGDKTERHLWISDGEGFPVYRIQQVARDEITLQIDNEYREPTSKFFLPTKSRWRSNIDNQGRARIDIQIEEVEGKYSDNVAASQFELVGLDLQKGAPIMDSRVKQIAGYWDGAGITRDIKAALKGQPAGVLPSPNGRWYWWIIPAALVLLGFGGWLWQRRRSQPA